MIFKIFNGKKILVTGHTGFKGSWLCLWLHILGARVYGYSLPPNTTPNHYTEARIKNILSGECLADIRDKSTLTKYIQDLEPDCIFHLTAQPLVRRSYSEPVDTFDTNVMGSIYVMEAARVMGKPCTVVMITTDKCYLNTGKKEGYIESDPLGGHDPYSASKAAAEVAIASYRQSFFENSVVNLVSVRAGNVVGGGDWAEDRIIPDAVRAVTSGTSLEIRNPNAVRPWQHVLEPLSGYLLLAEKLLEGERSFLGAWNFGPNANDAFTVCEIITLFYETWGCGDVQYGLPTANLHEAAYLTLSSEKAQTELGWKPQWDLSMTIKKTAVWYKKFYAGVDARDLSIADIHEYMELMSYE